MKYQEPLTKNVIVEQSYHYSNWKIKQNIIFHDHLILFKTKRQRPINYIAFTFFKQARKKVKVNNEIKKQYQIVRNGSKIHLQNRINVQNRYPKHTFTYPLSCLGPGLSIKCGVYITTVLPSYRHFNKMWCIHNHCPALVQAFQ